ncbi:carbohydrate-binding module family 1 protein [Stipitochalara longipes BDJ]|nr:carbohydrate-binding module family 1 protein [Stipitochalara longipes BDJ]
MAKDGGLSQYPGNKARAAYGIYYCNAQCPRDLKFINGQANADGWNASSNSASSGTGNHGSCCTEMDIWEANSISSAFTPHSAKHASQTICTGNACRGAGSSNRYGGSINLDGYNFNSYPIGDTTFYDPGITIDTTKVFTIVNQFLTDTGTPSGTINQIKRFYVQNGVIIPNSISTIARVTSNSITTDFYNAQKILDSDYPTTADPTTLDTSRRNCSTSSGVPATVEAASPNAYVIFSSIKVGPINSTFSASNASSTGSGPGSASSSSLANMLGTSTNSTSSSSPESSSLANTLETSTIFQATITSTVFICSISSVTALQASVTWEAASCGGLSYSSATTCVSPYTCTYTNPYYSQCL